MDLLFLVIAALSDPLVFWLVVLNAVLGAVGLYIREKRRE